MNPIDDQLNRLFRAAAKVRGESPATAPYGLETRALAAWRTARAGDDGFWDMTLLVRGLMLAIVIMGISFWPVLTTTSSSDPYSDYVQVTDSSLASDVAP